MRRTYTVKLPTDGATNVDIPVEGPFAGTLGQASALTAVGTDGFYAEWRNRPLTCPNKLSLGASQFVPRFRLGFNMSAMVVSFPASGAANTVPMRVIASGGPTNVPANTLVPINPVTTSPAVLPVGMRLAVFVRVTDAVNPGGFSYGPGPLGLTALPQGPPPFVVSAELGTTAAGGVSLGLINNDGINAHSVEWTIVALPASVGSAVPLPVIACSQSLVGNVITTQAGAVTAGDAALADPANRPSIRVYNGDDVAGTLLRVYLDVAEALADLQGG